MEIIFPELRQIRNIKRDIFMPGRNTALLLFAELDGLNIAVMQGRIHYYEGYDMPDVVFPLRVLHLLGAKR